MRKQRPEKHKMRQLFERARKMAFRPDSAPAIVTAMLSDVDSIKADDDLLRHVLSIGLSYEVRLFLGRHFADAVLSVEQARTGQVDMWPVEARTLMRRIDRAAVFVPSRNEHVELVPDAISIEEMGEAGQYLIGHGKDCVARGNALILVADIMREEVA